MVTVTIYTDEDKPYVREINDRDVAVYVGDPMDFCVSVADVDCEGNRIDPHVCVRDEDEDVFYGTVPQFLAWARRNREINTEK